MQNQLWVTVRGSVCFPILTRTFALAILMFVGEKKLSAALKALPFVQTPIRCISKLLIQRNTAEKSTLKNFRI